VRVLLVEDDMKIASFVAEGLQQAGFGVDRVDNGEDGLELALGKPYDIAVIDIMLPRLDGLAVVEAMRQSKVVTPVIILSAKRSVDDRVRGLQLGSDDYLTKPFAFSELLARVQATRPAASGVRIAGIPPAQCRTTAVEDDDPRNSVELQLRSPDECCRGSGLPLARKGRRRRASEVDSYAARSRVRSQDSVV
jgi:two-component system, OmpR family, response regulator